MALLLLTGLNLFNYLDRYILPGVQPLVEKEFGVNDERMGALTYAFPQEKGYWDTLRHMTPTVLLL